MSESPRVRVAAAVIWQGDRVLLTQRPPADPLGLQWEFPGGKLETGETYESAVVREIREELGVASTPHGTLAIERHDYPGGPSVEVAFVRCSLDSLALEPGPSVHAHRWVRPQDLDLDSVLAADRDFIRSLGARGVTG